jgi:hypothetical protein
MSLLPRAALRRDREHLLTLIVPGEVKVNLAIFDVEFQAKFLSIRYEKKPFTAETSFKSFLTSDMTSKNDI